MGIFRSAGSCQMDNRKRGGRLVLDVNPMMVVRRVIVAAVTGALPEENRHDAVVLLSEALQSPDDDMRGLAVIGLHEMGGCDDLIVPCLEQASRDPSEIVRRRAMRALGDLGTRAIPAIPHLIVALEDRDPSVRVEAIGAISRLGVKAEAAIPGLIRLLASEDCRVRTLVAVALRKIGSGCVPYLLALLSDTDANLRIKAIQLIGQIAVVNDDVIQGLLQACADGDAEVRRSARQAIERCNL